MKKGKRFKQILVVLLVMTLVAPYQAIGQNAGGETQAVFKQEELAQMLAPMALYPDPLIAQMLMASTYPLEVVEANRFVKANPDLKDDALDAALKEKEWDVSVKSLCHFPQVVSSMSEKLDWTTKLGDAFLAQQAEVMDMIQELRAKAHAEGNLKTTAEQKVIVEEKIIVIEPAKPEVVYVPTYSTTVVYGSWWYPAYPPYVWYYPPGAGWVAFGTGIALGIGYSHWAHCGWGRGDIDIDINRTNNFNKNVNRGDRPGGKQKWNHDRNHRKGAAYRDRNTSQRFGQSPNRSVEGRREARGYGDRGGLDRKTRDSMKKQGFDRKSPGSRGEGGLNRQTRQSSKQQGADRSSFSSRKGSDRKSSSAFSGSRSGRSSQLSSQRGRSSRGSYSGRSSRGSSRGGGRRGGGRR